MKRFAFLLMGAGSLGVTITACVLQNPISDAEQEFSGGARLVAASITCLISFAIAGWILSGTSIPREGIPHRLIMTFVAGLCGAFAAMILQISVFQLRAWLSPGPPPADIDAGP